MCVKLYWIKYKPNLILSLLQNTLKQAPGHSDDIDLKGKAQKVLGLRCLISCQSTAWLNSWLARLPNRNVATNHHNTHTFLM